MVLIPCVLLASFPPGLLFPQMAARMSGPGTREMSGTVDAESQAEPKIGASKVQAASAEHSLGEIQGNVGLANPR